VSPQAVQMPKIKVLDTEGRWNADAADEHLWWPRVQWIDPGGTSGLAVVWFDPKALFEGKTTAKVVLGHSEMFLNGPEDGVNGQVDRYLRVARGLEYELDEEGEPQHRKGLVMGCESFQLRMLNQAPEFLSPVRIRAKLDYELSMREHPMFNRPGVPLFTQTPSDAKKTFEDSRLHNLRMYTPGPDHIRDATRHCLLWIRKMRVAGLDFFKETHGYEEGWFE
jgi:hypothetical protein